MGIMSHGGICLPVTPDRPPSESINASRNMLKLDYNINSVKASCCFDFYTTGIIISIINLNQLKRPAIQTIKPLRKRAMAKLMLLILGDALQ